ncbi:hypothetical protein COV18_06895 [Candidatus Woesearchaeota archaeon CG10_big_fil_rev_8_21_14_0_10_37_12]|nr:MAG: hypothetical protein COV18_06895 [Candidatus Woesearchaeota archaeon CG10_big_fil_rev_8_21_14_0_10_37_12]
MSPGSLILIIVIILLTVTAIKFLVGAARTVITIGLIVLAIALILSVMSGKDPFEIKDTATGVTENVGQAIQGTTNTINETINAINETYQQIKTYGD